MTRSELSISTPAKAGVPAVTQPTVGSNDKTNFRLLKLLYTFSTSPYHPNLVARNRYTCGIAIGARHGSLLRCLAQRDAGGK